MFDTYHQGPSTLRVNTTQTVHEHRAPTDASVKLLDEMEEKMLGRIISKSTLHDNQFNAEWWVIEEHCLGDLKVVCRFKLNGTENKFEIPVCRVVASEPRKLLQIVLEKIRNEMAAILTEELFQKHNTKLLKR